MDETKKYAISDTTKTDKFIRTTNRYNPLIEAPTAKEGMYVYSLHYPFRHQLFPHCVHMLTMFGVAPLVQIYVQYFSIFMKFYILLYFAVIFSHLFIYT
jgi:hypothetical protein